MQYHRVRGNDNIGHIVPGLFNKLVEVVDRGESSPWPIFTCLHNFNLDPYILGVLPVS
jgi:hypothetical protein